MFINGKCIKETNNQPKPHRKTEQSNTQNIILGNIEQLVKVSDTAFSIGISPGCKDNAKLNFTPAKSNFAFTKWDFVFAKLNFIPAKPNFTNNKRTQHNLHTII